MPDYFREIDLCKTCIGEITGSFGRGVILVKSKVCPDQHSEIQDK